jgi:hypothetical protein
MANDQQHSIWEIVPEKITEHKPLQPSGRARVSLLYIITGVFTELLACFFSQSALSIGQDVWQKANALHLNMAWGFDPASVPEIAVGYAQLQQDMQMGTLFFWASLIFMVIGLFMTINAKIRVRQRLSDPKHLVYIARSVAAFALITEAILAYWLFIAGLYLSFMQ